MKKGKQRGKVVTKEEEVPSFFRFFETPDLASLEEEADEEDEEAQQEKMELFEQIQTEMAVAGVLREKLIPNAVNWFTGEAVDDGTSRSCRTRALPAFVWCTSGLRCVTCALARAQSPCRRAHRRRTCALYLAVPPTPVFLHSRIRGRGRGRGRLR
jgi:hypothetical protein